jgi:hypothetical protein
MISRAMARPSPVPPLGTRIRAVDLPEFLEDVLAFLRRDAGTGIADAHGKVAIGYARRDAHLPGVRELYGVAHQIEQHLGQALLVAEAIVSSLATSVLKASFLVAASDSVATITVSTMCPRHIQQGST